MDNINELINQAMEDWDQETNAGETDPAFSGEVGEEIETLVNGLSAGEVQMLLGEPAPIIFVDATNDFVDATMVEIVKEN